MYSQFLCIIQIHVIVPVLTNRAGAHPYQVQERIKAATAPCALLRMVSTMWCKDLHGIPMSTNNCHHHVLIQMVFTKIHIALVDLPRAVALARHLMHHSYTSTY